MRRTLPLLVAAAVIAAGTAWAGEFDLEAAKSTFEKRCSKCHTVDRPLKKNKDRAGWEKTVSRMVRYASGAISEDEAAVIVEYLSRVRGPAQ